MPPLAAPERDDALSRMLRRVPDWLPITIMIAIVFGLGADAARSFIFKGRQGDFIHFHEAAKALLAGDDIYLAYKQWYSYPPLLAVLLAPLGKLPLGQAGAVWAMTNAVLISGLMTWTARELLRRFAIAPTLKNVGAAGLVATLLMADKIRAEMRLGQSDAVVMIGMFGALSFLGRRSALCGVLLGLAANIKYQSLAVLPYLLIRRRWTEAVAALLGGGLIALASALVFGWERNLEYLSRAFNGLKFVVGMIPKDRTGPDLYPLHWERSVSIPSTLARAVLRVSGGTELSSAGKLVVMGGVGLLAAACVGLAWWLFHRAGLSLWKGRGGAADDATPQSRAIVGLEWAGLVAGVLAFSPQTTNRHMILVIFLALVGSVILLFRPRRVRAGWLIAGMIVGLLGLILPPGGSATEPAQMAWRAVGGPTWCVLFMYYTTLAAGLSWIGGGEADAPISLPRPRRTPSLSAAAR